MTENQLTAKDVDRFETLFGQIMAMYNEYSLLSRKDPNSPLNPFKITFLNTLILAMNKFLGKYSQPFDVVAFDEAALPTYSDVVVILSQYIASFEKMKSDCVYFNYGVWYWRGAEKETTKPKY